MVAAVAYYRMSTDKQDTSISDQRTEVTAFAKRDGYTILREYPDEGISGDATEKRFQFQKMIRDATERADFEAVLCWDQDRFGRFDSLEAGYWIKPLRDAGVRLVTVAQGVIDWNDFAGRMIYGIQQEAKHQFLRDLSRNVSRTQRQIALSGQSPSGGTPYGFDKLYLDEAGNVLLRVRHGEIGARKQKNWRQRLVPSDDHVKVETVQWLFHTYDELDVSLSWLAMSLNDRGIPSPSGVLWIGDMVQRMFMNPVYVGDVVFGRRRKGKYHFIAKSDVKPVHRAECNHRNPPEQWIVIGDAHEALVSRELQKRVQAKLKARRCRTTPIEGRNNNFLFPQLLYCAHCGRMMIGKKDTRRGAFAYYCGSYTRWGGNKNPHGCGAHRLRQDELLHFLMSVLTETVLAGGHLDALTRQIEKALSERYNDDPQQLAQKRRKLAALDRQIDQAVERLLTSPDDISDVLSAKITTWRRRRDVLAADVHAAERLKGAANVKSEARAVAEKLLAMRDEMERANPARVRELLRRFVKRIDFWWKPRKAKTKVARNIRKLKEMDRGEITLAVDVIASTFFVAPGEHSSAVAMAKSPTLPAWTLPASVHNQTITVQVRVHESDIENDSLSDTVRVELDAGNDPVNAIYGTGLLLAVELRDSGGVRFRFQWYDAVEGVSPLLFRAHRTAGPTSPADQTTIYVAGRREYTIDVAGLTDAGAYTFELTAENGATTKLLTGNNGTDIDFTADGSGPPAATGVALVQL